MREPTHSASTGGMLPGTQTPFLRCLAAKRSSASRFSRSLAPESCARALGFRDRRRQLAHCWRQLQRRLPVSRLYGFRGCCCSSDVFSIRQIDHRRHHFRIAALAGDIARLPTVKRHGPVHLVVVHHRLRQQMQDTTDRVGVVVMTITDPASLPLRCVCLSSKRNSRSSFG
jgi:hypothetical protein